MDSDNPDIDTENAVAIIGMASYGRSIYEKIENSGIASNGLTSARHDLLSPHYRERFPETFDPATDPKIVYCGPHRMQDPLPDSNMTVGQALLSPTRTYAPVMQKLLTSHREKILGLVHCSGGGQTKCIRFGENVHFIKENLLPVPPVFREIQKVSGTSAKEMHQVFNMGHRMEIYCNPADVDAILADIEPFAIPAQVVGRTKASTITGGANHVTVETLGETLEYSLWK